MWLEQYNKTPVEQSSKKSNNQIDNLIIRKFQSQEVNISTQELLVKEAQPTKRVRNLGAHRNLQALEDSNHRWQYNYQFNQR